MTKLERPPPKPRDHVSVRSKNHWRLLRRTLAAAALLLVASMGALWWWAGSDGSLATALRWAEKSQPLVASGVSGALRTGGRVESLSWAQGGLQVEATGVELAWQPLSLLSGRLHLERVGASTLRINDQRPPSPASPQPPASVALPLQITLDTLSVDRLQVLGAAAFEVTAIQASYQFDGLQHQLGVSNLQLASGRYAGQIRLNADQVMTLDARLTGQLDTRIPNSPSQLPLALSASVQGPLADLQLQAELQVRAEAGQSGTPTQAKASAHITPWATQPVQQADADFRALDLARLWPQAPQTSLTGELHVRPDGAGSDAWQLQINVSNSLPGPWDQQRLPLNKLQAEGEWRGGVALVRSLQAQLGEGQLQASGQWSTAPATGTAAPATWTVQAALKNINPAALHTALAPLPLDGRAELKGQGQAIGFDVNLTTRSVATAGPANTPGNNIHQLRLRDASARGRWAQGQLSLTSVQLRSDDAQINGALTLQPAARSGSGQITFKAPGVDGQLDGALSETRGAGKFTLHGRDAAQALAWLKALPGMPAALKSVSIKGQAELQLGWQGGWRDPALQAQLTIPSLDWQPPPDRRANPPGGPLKLRAVQADLSGRLSQAALKVEGRAEMDQRRYTLQLAASGGQAGPAPATFQALLAARWQALLEQFKLSVQDPALGAGTWALSSRQSVPLKWTPTPAGSNLEVGAGQALLTAPRTKASNAAELPSQATLIWQAASWRAGELQSAGKLTGLPLAWIELIAGPQMTGAGLTGDLIFDGQWDVVMGQNLRLNASLVRSSGDLTVQTETLQGNTTRVAAGVRQASLSLASDGDAVNLAVRWDSERAGSIDGQFKTRLLKRGAGSSGLMLGDRVWALDAPLSGQLRAQLPKIGVWSVLAPPGWRLRGSLATNLVISGNRAAPQLSGTLQADDLALRSVVDGIEFGQGRLRATLAGTRIRISEFTLNGAGDKGTGGLLHAQGEAAWIDGQLQVQLTTRLERLRASLRSDRQLTLSGDIQASLKGKEAALTGKLRVDEALFILPDESTPQLGDDVIVRSAGGVAVGRQAPAAVNPAGSPAGEEGRVVKLAVELDLGQNFRVQGKGLETRLQGNLVLSGDSFTRARLNGIVRTVGGQYQAYGQRLDVEQGVIRFTGAVNNPSLDILAIRPNLTQRVGVQITGTALLPRVRLYSQPELSDVEKLSWLVVGHAAADGGAESALLQQAALALLGSKSGGGMSGGLAASLGLDEVSYKGGASNGDGTTGQGAITLGKRFSRNFYAAYERSLSGAMGTLFVFYDLSKRFTLRAQAGEQSAVDLIFTLPYD
jgi:translocation and assembly module TamB